MYDNSGDHAKALEHLQPYLSALTGVADDVERGIFLHTIGSFYSRLGQYRQASEYYRRSLVLLRNASLRRTPPSFFSSSSMPTLAGSQQSLARARERGDRTQEAAALHSMGIAYAEQQQYPQALESFQDALEIRQTLGDCSNEADTLSNIGDIYIHLHQYSQALEPLQQALFKIQSNCAANLSERFVNRTIESSTLNNLGVVYAELAQYDQAMQRYDQARVITRDLGDDLLILVREGTVLSNMGQTLREQHHIDEAIAASQEAVGTWYRLRNSGDNPPYAFQAEIYTTSQILVELLHQQGREDEATEYRNHQ